MKEIKNKRIQIRLNSEDYLIIKENLIDKKINISALVRDYLLEMATGEPKITIEKIKEIITDEDILNYLCNQIHRRLS